MTAKNWSRFVEDRDNFLRQRKSSRVEIQQAQEELLAQELEEAAESNRNRARAGMQESRKRRRNGEPAPTRKAKPKPKKQTVIDTPPTPETPATAALNQAAAYAADLLDDPFPMSMSFEDLYLQSQYQNVQPAPSPCVSGGNDPLFD